MSFDRIGHGDDAPSHAVDMYSTLACSVCRPAIGEIVRNILIENGALPVEEKK